MDILAIDIQLSFYSFFIHFAEYLVIVFPTFKGILRPPYFYSI